MSKTRVESNTFCWSNFVLLCNNQVIFCWWKKVFVIDSGYFTVIFNFDRSKLIVGSFHLNSISPIRAKSTSIQFLCIMFAIPFSRIISGIILDPLDNRFFGPFLLSQVLGEKLGRSWVKKSGSKRWIFDCPDYLTKFHRIDQFCCYSSIAND